MRIFFYRTGWSLLLYMLYTSKWEDTFYCFEKEEQVPKYFINNNIPYFVYKTSAINKGRLFKIYNRLKDEIRYLSFINQLRNIKDRNCFGDDDSLLSKPFIDSNFCVIEDGLANYTPDNIKYLHSIGFFGYGCKYMPMGFDPLIKKVILSGAFSIPDQLKDKAISVNAKRLWREKSSTEKNKILAVFNTSSGELEKYKSNYVLLTQNYDSYGIKSKENEYSRYVKILKNYPYGEVLIKPHPLSTFNYSKAFPDYKVIQQKIPFELMSLYNNYKVLISITSTAAFTLPGEKQIDLYDIDGDLKKRFYVTNDKSIDVSEIKALIPRVKPPTLTLKELKWRIHLFLLRNFVWKLR